MKEAPKFLLVGNGPYLNHGCEAIVRGTMAILEHEFGANIEVTLASYETPEVVTAQAAMEYDKRITHVPLVWPATPRWSRPWWLRQAARPFGATRNGYSMLDKHCEGVTGAIQIGGDNFSLDYGLLTAKMFMGLDDDLMRRGLSVVLWGASVGPFEAEPLFADLMVQHLRTLRAIFVRESESYDYLVDRGFGKGLYRMADPAFVMEPVRPSPALIGCDLPAEATGLNLSPLMARYVTAGDIDAWVGVAAELVGAVIDATGRDVILVPHVTWPKTDDRAFLARVVGKCSKLAAARTHLVSGELTAAELKSVISQCSVFCGARTHSTIAAISSAVPTLSLAYSRKAKGLNQDIFGSQRYCVQPSDVTPAGVATRVTDIWHDREPIREYLSRQLPGIRREALQAGALLREAMAS